MGDVGKWTGAVLLAPFTGGLSLGWAAMSKTMPKIPGARRNKILLRESTVPRRIIYGETVVSGAWIFTDETGENNKYLHMVVAIAGHTVQEISEVYLNDMPLPDDALFDTTPAWVANTAYLKNDLVLYKKKLYRAKMNLGVSQNYPNPKKTLYWDVAGDDRYKGKVTVKKHLGWAYQAADTDLTAVCPQWTTAHRLQGVAYVYLRIAFAATFGGQVPTPTFKVKGKKVYDPRVGLSSWSDNWALCVRDYMRMAAPDGMGCDADEVDDASVIAAANICDQLVVCTADGLTTEKRYTCNGYLDVEGTPEDGLKDLLTAGGTAFYSQGQWRIRAHGYSAPVADLNEDHLAGPLKWEIGPKKSDKINTVRGTFIDPKRFFAETDFPAMRSATYITDDGEELTADMDLLFTNSASRCQRLAKIALEQARGALSVEFPAKLSCYKFAPEDRITLTISRLGWDHLVFRVVEVTASITDGVKLSLQSDSANIYDWTAGEVFERPETDFSTLPDPSYLDPPTNLVVTEGTYTTNMSSVVKAKTMLSWTTATDAVTHYEIQADGPNDSTFVPLGESIDKTFTGYDIKPGSWYFRVRAVNSIAQSDWLTSAATTIVGNVTANDAIDNAKQQWLQVSGTGRPADNANKTTIVNGAISGVESGSGTVVDNSLVKVGGRNLYTNTTPITDQDTGVTGITRSVSGFSFVGIVANTGIARMNNIIPKNGQFTISFDLAVSLSGGFPLTLDFNDTGLVVFNPTTTVQRFSHTFTISNYTSATYNFIDFNGLSGQTYTFTNFKVEEGNIATTWTPAPEDVQSQFDAMTTDSIFDKAEKLTVRRQLAEMLAEKDTLVTAGNAVGVTDTITAAYNTLNNTLIASPYYVNVDSDVTITPATFRGLFSTYATNKETYRKTISDKASTMATWAGIPAGSGKPADNATKNTVTYSTAAPSSPTDGDIWVDTSVTPNLVKLRVTGAWQTGANYTTNTNQLTDGASLGTTATWTGVGSKPTNINALTGSEAIQNSQISVDSTGALQGIGTGAGSSVANNVDSIIRAPGGGLYTSTTSLTGNLKIQLPQSWTNTMLRFYVDIYEYSAGYSCTLELAGYNYVGTPAWINVTARVVGASNVEYPVYFGHDGTKCCIWIGTAGETWSYPQVRIKDFFAGYNNYSKSLWESGWQISFDPAGPLNVTQTVLDTLPGANWSKVSGTGRPADNATVGAPSGTYVGGTPAITVESNAANANAKVNDWVKPGQTTIDGNKIYTGDAYVDTLQIKGNAVVISGLTIGDASTLATDAYPPLLAMDFDSNAVGQPFLVTGGTTYNTGTISTRKIASVVKLITYTGIVTPSSVISKGRVLLTKVYGMNLFTTGTVYFDYEIKFTGSTTFTWRRSDLKSARANAAVWTEPWSSNVTITSDYMFLDTTGYLPYYLNTKIKLPATSGYTTNEVISFIMSISDSDRDSTEVSTQNVDQSFSVATPGLVDYPGFYIFQLTVLESTLTYNVTWKKPYIHCSLNKR